MKLITHYKICSFLLSISLILLLPSCKYFDTNRETNNGRIVAEYDEKDRLLESDIRKVVPPGISSIDSVAFVQKYIKSWALSTIINDNVLTTSRLMNIIDQEVERYRSELIKHYFIKNKVKDVQNELAPTEEELRDYYEANKKTYKATEDKVQYIFLEIPNRSPATKDLERWLREKDVTTLINYANRNLDLFHYTDSVHWEGIDHAKEVTEDRFSRSEILASQKQFIKKVDNQTGLTSYFLLLNKNLKGEILDFHLASPVIETLLFNRNKVKFIEDLENQMYKESLADGTLKIYFDESN